MRLVVLIVLLGASAVACGGGDEPSPTPPPDETIASSETMAPAVCAASADSPGYELRAPDEDAESRTPVAFTLGVEDQLPAFVTLSDRSDPGRIYGYFEVDPATPAGSEIGGEIPFAIVSRRDACLTAYVGADATGGLAGVIGSSVPVELLPEPGGVVCESTYVAPGPFVVRLPQSGAGVPANIQIELATSVSSDAIFELSVTDVDGMTIGSGRISQDGDVASGEVSVEAAGVAACVTILYTLPSGALDVVARIPVAIQD